MMAATEGEGVRTRSLQRRQGESLTQAPRGVMAHHKVSSTVPPSRQPASWTLQVRRSLRERDGEGGNAAGVGRRFLVFKGVFCHEGADDMGKRELPVAR